MAPVRTEDRIPFAMNGLPWPEVGVPQMPGAFLLGRLARLLADRSQAPGEETRRPSQSALLAGAFPGGRLKKEGPAIGTPQTSKTGTARICTGQPVGGGKRNALNPKRRQSSQACLAPVQLASVKRVAGTDLRPSVSSTASSSRELGTAARKEVAPVWNDGSVHQHTGTAAACLATAVAEDIFPVSVAVEHGRLWNVSASDYLRAGSGSRHCSAPGLTISAFCNAPFCCCAFSTLHFRKRSFLVPVTAHAPIAALTGAISSRISGAGTQARSSRLVDRRRGPERSRPVKAFFRLSVLSRARRTAVMALARVTARPALAIRLHI